MNDQLFKTSGSAVYREVGEELVVIQVDTGCFYYFDKSTKRFLDFFKDPTSLDQLLDRLDPEPRAADGTYLQDFCRSLVEKRILEPAAVTAGAREPSGFSYERPTFLREGERKLSEIASEVAVLTTYT